MFGCSYASKQNLAMQLVHWLKFYGEDRTALRHSINDKKKKKVHYYFFTKRMLFEWHLFHRLSKMKVYRTHVLRKAFCSYSDFLVRKKEAEYIIGWSTFRKLSVLLISTLEPTKNIWIHLFLLLLNQVI